MPGSRGYATFVNPDAAVREYDTVTCGHCQRVIFLKPGTGGTVYYLPSAPGQPYHEEMGASCACCMTPVCLPCHDRGGCTPWEKRLAEMEARDRFRRSVGV